MLEKFLVAPFAEGISTELEPWLLPDKAFVRLENAYLRRGRLQKRSGLVGLAEGGKANLGECISKMVQSETAENYGTTDGAGAISFILKNIPITPAKLKFVIGAELITDNGIGTLTGSVSAVGTITYATGAVSITGGAVTTVCTGATIADGSVIFSTLNAPVRQGDITFTIGAETFTDSLGIITGSFSGTGTINYITGLISITAATANTAITLLAYSHFPTLPVMALSEYIRSDLIRRTVAIDTRTFNIHNTTTNRFAEVTHATTWTGGDSDFWSTANYIGENRGHHLVITNGSDVPEVYTGTVLKLISDVATFPTFLQPGAGSLDAARAVFFHGNRLCFFAPTLGGTFYPNRLVFSRPSISAAPYDFLNVGSGFIDASTDDEIMGGAFVGDQLSIFFRNSVWNCKVTTDSDFPFRWERIDADGVANCDARFSVSSHFGKARAIGQIGIIATDSNSVGRIDRKIPDFTRDSIDPSLIQYSYSGISYDNTQVFTTYAKTGDTRALARSTDILVEHLEDGVWSNYTLPMHVIGRHRVTEDKAWDDFTDPWDSYGEKWDSYTTQDNAIVTSGGDFYGFVYIMDEDGNDSSFDIQGITLASPCVITGINGFEVGDSVLITGVVGTTQLNGKYFIITARTNSSITIDTDSTGFTAWTSGGNVAKAIAFDVKTKPLNPWIAEDKMATLEWIDFRIPVGSSTTCNVQFFINERSAPYDLSMTGGDTVAIDFSTTNQDPNKWYRVHVGITAESHQIRLFQNKVDDTPVFDAIRLGMSPAGTTESI